MRRRSITFVWPLTILTSIGSWPFWASMASPKAKRQSPCECACACAARKLVEVKKAPRSSTFAILTASSFSCKIRGIVVGPVRSATFAHGPSPHRSWSHCTNSGSDRARSNKFYLELFGFRIQAYQGPGNPVFGFGNAGQFLAFGAGGGQARPGAINHFCMTMDNFKPEKVIKTLESHGIKPRGSAQGAPGPLVHYISRRMEDRGGAKEGTPELYFTDPDGLIVQTRDFRNGVLHQFRVIRQLLF